MEASMFETLRKMMLVGLGVQEKMREILDEMVEKGQISREEGDTLLNKLMGQAEQNVNTMEEKMKELISTVLSTMDLPTKKDLEELRDQVALLQKSIDKLQQGGGS
ncbi:MAG: hypothetical protein D6739_10305 [Nitrospirae bacterium]|nr:MAG: hypothetical protein D6739_10305 [Nitrospirota bacterium]